jgi:hypothetical protein
MLWWCSKSIFELVPTLSVCILYIIYAMYVTVLDAELLIDYVTYFNIYDGLSELT